MSHLPCTEKPSFQVVVHGTYICIYLYIDSKFKANGHMLLKHQNVSLTGEGNNRLLKLKCNFNKHF